MHGGIYSLLVLYDRIILCACIEPFWHGGDLLVLHVLL